MNNLKQRKRATGAGRDVFHGPGENVIEIERSHCGTWESAKVAKSRRRARLFQKYACGRFCACAAPALLYLSRTPRALCCSTLRSCAHPVCRREATYNLPARAVVEDTSRKAHYRGGPFISRGASAY